MNIFLLSSIFRSCGTSSSAKQPEQTHFGFYPLKNRCNKYKAVKESLFPNAEFEICSCAQDLSNSKGEMKCNVTNTKQSRSFIHL